MWSTFLDEFLAVVSNTSGVFGGLAADLSSGSILVSSPLASVLSSTDLFSNEFAVLLSFLASFSDTFSDPIATLSSENLSLLDPGAFRFWSDLSGLSYERATLSNALFGGGAASQLRNFGGSFLEASS